MKCKKNIKVLSVFSVIFCAVTFSSCHYIFADPEAARSKETDGIEIIIPALPAQSSGTGSSSASNTWSVYALLCSENADLNDSLLNKIIVDGERDEDADFVNAHEHEGILAQQSFIEKSVNEPISVSFPKIVAGTKFFVRIVIVQNGKITHTGTSPEQRNALAGGTGGIFSINKNGLHVVQNGQNIVHVILRKVRSRVYYVKDGGTAAADVSTKNEPTTIDAALAAVASEQQAADIILVGDVRLQPSLLKDALEKAGDIELSSLAGSMYTLTVSSGDIEIPASTELVCENIKIAGVLALKEKSRLFLVDAQCTNIIAEDSTVIVSGASIAADVKVKAGAHLSLTDTASVETLMAEDATVTCTVTDGIKSNINLKGDTTFTGDIEMQSAASANLSDTACVNGTITAANNSTIMLKDSAKVTGISATDASVTLVDDAKIDGNLTANDGTVTVGAAASITGNITLSGSTTFAAADTITVKAGTSLSLSDSTKVTVPVGKNITVEGGTIKLGGSPIICDVSNKSVPIVLDESGGTWGHIAVTKQLSLSEQLSVSVRNTESAYAPFATVPVLEYAAGIAANHEQFKWEFDRPGVWDFVSQPQGSTTVVYIKTVPQPVWLFEGRISNTSTYVDFYYGAKTYIGQGNNYSFDVSGIFAEAGTKLYTYGKNGNNNVLFELSATSEMANILQISGAALDVYADGNDIYYVYEIDNGIQIEKYSAEGNSQRVKAVTGSDANYLKNRSGYLVALCKVDDMFLLLYKQSTKTNGTWSGENVLLAVPLTGQIRKYGLPVILPLKTSYNDILCYNGDVYILAGQCGKDDASVYYSRGGVIKVSVNGELTVDKMYGCCSETSSNNTAEGNDNACFYNPERFLGTDGDCLIIADDGRTAGGIQKDRVVYFDTKTLQIERVYYTDAGFEGTR